MASLEVINNSNVAAGFDLSLNGNDLFAGDDDIVAAIKATPAFLERGFAYAAWDWLTQNTYHFDPYTGDAWQEAPYLYLNSLGFGYCDDVASVFAALMISQGYDARVWGVEGHVVSEVFNNGRWELYDVDLRALYIDTQGNIAGYDYIVNSQDDFAANLSSSSYANDVHPDDIAYADWILDFYKSTADNVSFLPGTLAEFSGDHKLVIPAHASLSIHNLSDHDLISMYDTVVPNVSVLDVKFGAIQGFTFEYPLIPLSISGEGTVVIDDVVYDIGSDELNERLASRDDPIFSIVVNTTGSDNEITYLINPIRFSLKGDSLDVDLLGLVGDAETMLTGTAGSETLEGHGARDTIIGGGGADTLLGGDGDDVITQTAAVVNGAAGSVLDGGMGNDSITFDGSQACTTNYVSILGGAGRDTIDVATGQGQYLGSVRIDGGADNDTITVGHIEADTGALGWIDGGSGDDVIKVVDTWNGIGIWSNAAFQIDGGEGNDRFELAGTQLNVLGNDQGVRLDGGSGFDTLVWNGHYNLEVGGHQNADLGLFAGQYAQELVVGNIELLDLAGSGASGLHVSFSAQDVASITSGSDFDRASLGLGLTGVGNTLFVTAGSNEVNLAGWTDISAATVGGVQYELYHNDSAYLGVLFAETTLTGTAGDETLEGHGARDTIVGGGGADTLLGGGGDDVITQTAAVVNGGAGSVLDGGFGNDSITFDGSQAYTTNYVSILGGAGRDTIDVATAQLQYLGSVRIDGGADNDTITVGHIEGSTGLGWIDGGSGDDLIKVVDTWNGIGIWSNAAFQIDGGEGNDRFELAGTQLNVLGNDQGVRLDGGSGFDTLVWNGHYNLEVGGHQNADLGLFAGQYAQELVVGNIELLDLAGSGASGLHVSFSAQDVASITSGSDFDRASLGLGLTGVGNTLFVTAGSNEVSLAGWTDIGAATVGGVQYELYHNDSAYLGVLFAETTLTGTAGDETLEGHGARDTIVGGGGADTLLGGGGDDVITQTAAVVNGAAGSVLDGGFGNDSITFDGSQAYTTNYVSILGGAGRDTIDVATAQLQYLGSVRIDGGADNDTITVGHIEGSTGLGWIDGGSGDDLIKVVDTWNGIGIWSNAAFQIDGGEGNDRFELAGTQLNVLGNDQGVRLDGGSGFDTLVWNGHYNLEVGGHQNADLGLFAGQYAQELVVGNIELLDLAGSGASGLHVSFSAQDVASITSGSDFDRASLGLGLTGVGNTLFVTAGSNEVNLAGWTDIGAATVSGVQYELYHNDSAYLGVLFAETTLTGTAGDETLEGHGARDTIVGGGGADTLLGGGGDDVITQTAAVVNGAAGSVLDGGFGNDSITFDGSQAYTTNYVSILGGAGRDTIDVATAQLQYLGSVRIDGGADNDTITVGHIEGSTGLGWIDGGSGDDLIKVVDTWNGIGIWSNAAFQIDGGEGNDRFELAGTQLNVLGNDQGVRLDGGSGFDTLVWNGHYNLEVGGHQNADLGLFAGQYAQELVVGNIELLDLAGSGASGLHVSFSAQDVASITSGSDFDRASLGLGLTGVGNTLFVTAGSNEVNLAGWTDIGAATVSGVQYELYHNDSAYLGVLFAETTLTGTAGDETLEGHGARDTIVGGGGADTLLGGGGDDVITQTAAVVNGAAGSVLDGGFGNDSITFDGSQAYTTNYVSILGGAGRDTIDVATAQLQYLGSVRIDGGADNDTITVGHIEGSTGLGWIDGGSGDDLIKVVDTWNGIGIWSNAAFQIDGGEGNDRFELAGTQLNVLGNDQGVRLDGGSGFDTLVWNGHYNLEVGGHQNADLGLFAGQYAQELVVGNIELLDLAGSGASGLHVSFSAQDVASITSGSDFDRASLGLGLTGVGNTLFVTAGSNEVSLAGWTDIGAATVGGVQYELYHSDASLLAINHDLFLV